MDPRMVGAKAILFVSYYWEVHEDGERAKWGYDSELCKVPMNANPKQLEQEMQEKYGYNKVVITFINVMSVEPGIPLVRGVG